VAEKNIEGLPPGEIRVGEEVGPGWLFELWQGPLSKIKSRRKISFWAEKEPGGMGAGK
jgi:hypothetical protein